MNYIINCDKCKGKYTLSAVQLTERNITSDSTNEHLLLTLHKCPLCGAEHLVMIDNTATLERLAKYKEYCVKATKYGRRNAAVPEKLASKIYSLGRQLKHRRDVLNRKYNGTFYQFDGQKYKLELYAPDINSGEGEPNAQE